MANFKYFGNGIQIGSGFDLSARTPLDSRTVAATLNELYSYELVKLYKGLTVFVESNNTKYTYIGDGTTNTSNDWRKDISSSDASTQVVDNVETQSSTQPLSANQGYLLNNRLTDAEEAIDNLNGDEQTEGSVSNKVYIAQTTLQNNINTVANNLTEVSERVETYNTARINDISSLDTKVETYNTNTNNKFDDEVDRLDGRIDTLTSTVTTNKNDIESALATEISNREAEDVQIRTDINNRIDDEVDALETAIQLVDGKADTNASNISTISDSLSETIEVVNDHTTAIDILNGTADIVGSVRHTINDVTSSLFNSVDQLVSKISKIETITITSEGQTVLSFGSQIPNGYVLTNDAIKLYINALTYVEGTSFIVNRTNKNLSWSLTAQEGGFDLDVDDVVQIEYSCQELILSETPTAYNLTDPMTKIVNEIGDFDTDPSTYSFGLNISEFALYGVQFAGVIINGQTLSSASEVSYNESTGIVTIYGIKLIETDLVQILAL